jgi:hypothetical protein
MKVLKIVLIVAVVYVGIVVAFESLIGILQPSAENTLVLTSFSPDGTSHDRVLSGLESDGQLYVAANHWPRAWYDRVLESPEVRVTREGEQAEFQAVPVSGEEHDRVEADHPAPLAFRVVTGFPPRYFVRLDPR